MSTFEDYWKARGFNPDPSMVASNFGPADLRDAFDAGRAAAAPAPGDGTADALIRDILESLCRRDGIPLESYIEPGKPARNYALAERLGIGHVFGLPDAAAPAAQAARADEFARVKVRLSALVTSLDETVTRGGTSAEEFDQGAGHASAVTARQLREILNDTALGTTPQPAPGLPATTAESRRYRDALEEIRAIILEGDNSTEGSRLRRSRAVIRAALEGR